MQARQIIDMMHKKAHKKHKGHKHVGSKCVHPGGKSHKKHSH